MNFSSYSDKRHYLYAKKSKNTKKTKSSSRYNFSANVAVFRLINFSQLHRRGSPAGAVLPRLFQLYSSRKRISRSIFANQAHDNPPQLTPDRLSSTESTPIQYEDPPPVSPPLPANTVKTTESGLPTKNNTPHIQPWPCPSFMVNMPLSISKLSFVAGTCSNSSRTI